MGAVRKTVAADLPAVARLYEEARRTLRARGVDQWQEGDYPSAADAEADVDGGVGYVYEEDGKILATACIAFGREPTYEVMEQGSWAEDPEEYGFLHRIAVAPEAGGLGIAGRMFAELERQAGEKGVSVIRADTHRDNLAMQRVLAKAGLVCRGVIRLEDGSERLAFEAVLTGEKDRRDERL